MGEGLCLPKCGVDQGEAQASLGCKTGIKRFFSLFSPFFFLLPSSLYLFMVKNFKQIQKETEYNEL